MRALVSLLALSLAGGACSDATAERTARPPARPAEAGPLILELFTSQGCSSCPPADRLLATLAVEPDLEPLSFHVDYWNDLGWSDPYSAPAWTERQHAYARALGEPRVYTPELVIGGTTGLVGSRPAAVRDAIARADRPARLAASARWTPEHLEVTASAPPDAEVLVAVWEAERSVRVPRGENAGETLANVRIVRRLERVAAPGTQGTLRIPLDRAWKATGAVAFAQRPDKRIVATARLPR